MISPDGRIRFGNLKIAEGDIFVRRNFQLKIISRRESNVFCTVRWFQDQFLDEGCDAVVTDDAEVHALRGARSGSPGFQRVYPDSAVAFFDWISGQSATDRGPSRRAVNEVESSVVLRTLDCSLNQYSFRKMRVSVSADSVSRIEFAGCVANHGKCLVAMIEANDVAVPHALNRTDIEPPLRVGEGRRVENRFRTPLSWFRQLALHMKHGIFHLSKQSGEDFTPCGQQARIWFGAIVLDQCVKAWQRMIWH